MSEFTVIPNNNPDLVFADLVEADQEHDYCIHTTPIVGWNAPVDLYDAVSNPIPVVIGEDYKGVMSGAILNLADEKWFELKGSLHGEGREELLAELIRNRD